MDTYIVRIFRRSGQNPEEIVGTSEHVETGEKQVFKDMKKLSGIIAGTEQETGHPTGNHKR